MTRPKDSLKQKSKYFEKFYLDENTEKYQANSTMIKTVWYNSQSRIMRIEFNNGNIYEYKKVLPRYFKRLKISESAGKFFNKYLKEKNEGRLVNE